MKSIKTVLSTLLLCALSTQIVFAEETPLNQYNIEMLIFQIHQPKNGQQATTVPEEQHDLLFKHAIDLKYDPENSFSPYILLPEEDFQLTKEEKKLNQSKHYHVIFHQAWRQPITSSRYAQPVRLVSSDNLGEDNLFRQNHLINGMITLSQSTYINSKLQLIISQPEKSFSIFTPFSPSRSLIHYEFNQKRRLKLNELNYLDNPQFGVLLLIKEAPSMTASLEDQ